MSLLSLARALRSLSYSSGDISELESEESESVSEDSGSPPGNAPGIVEVRADGCRAEVVRVRGGCCCIFEVS